MSKSPPEWVLDPSVSPTRAPTRAQIAEAFAALQVEVRPGAKAEDVIGALVVAIVKHLMRSGFTVEIGSPTLGTDRPDKAGGGW